MELNDYITDLFVDFDEMGFAPTTLCPDPEAYAIEWRNKITKAFKELTEQTKKDSKLIDELIKEGETYLAQRDCFRNQVKNLTVENERLRAERDVLDSLVKDLRGRNEGLQRANKSLAKDCDLLEDELNECVCIKADTVREMQERLDKHFCHDPAFLGVEQRLIMDVIDQIAKEMLEGSDG